VPQETLLPFCDCSESENSVSDSPECSKQVKKDPIGTMVIRVAGLSPCTVCFFANDYLHGESIGFNRAV